MKREGVKVLKWVIVHDHLEWWWWQWQGFTMATMMAMTRVCYDLWRAYNDVNVWGWFKAMTSIFEVGLKQRCWVFVNKHNMKKNLKLKENTDLGLKERKGNWNWKTHTCIEPLCPFHSTALSSCRNTQKTYTNFERKGDLN
jgi:hypothetical protein